MTDCLCGPANGAYCRCSAALPTILSLKFDELNPIRIVFIVLMTYDTRLMTVIQPMGLMALIPISKQLKMQDVLRKIPQSSGPAHVKDIHIS